MNHFQFLAIAAGAATLVTASTVAQASDYSTQISETRSSLQAEISDEDAPFPESWMQSAWGNETAKITHWCRDHSAAASKNKPVHYNSSHQQMRFETQAEKVENNDYTYEKIKSVEIELSHAGDGVVRTWKWMPSKVDELELNGNNTFTVLFDKCYKTLDIGANMGRGAYSAKATIVVTLIKKKDDPKVADTRTLTASTDFTVVEFDTQIAGTDATNDDIVQIRDSVCMHNFYESLNIRLKVPGNSTDVPGVITSTTDRAPFVKGAENAEGAAPATEVKKAFSAPGSPSSSASLRVHGKNKSLALKDEIYHLTMDNDPCGNNPAATKEATVYSFEGSIALAAGSSATESTSAGLSSLEAQPGIAISMTGSVKLVPGGLDMSIPQLSSLRCGFVQNIWAIENYVLYKNPVMSWAPSATIGNVVTIPKSIKLISFLYPGKAIDSVAGARPLYTRSANAMKALIPNVSVSISSSDTPTYPYPSQQSRSATSGGAALVGVANYLDHVAYDLNEFDTFVVVYRPSSGINGPVHPLARQFWTYKVNSTTGGSAVVGANETPPKLCPAHTLPDSPKTGNELFGAYTQSTTDEGSLTIPFPLTKAP